MDGSRARIQKALQDGVDLHGQLAAQAETMISIGNALAGCFLSRHKVLIFGNGGSAADAQHMAAELVGRFRTERAALPAIALTTDCSVLTSVANDYGYEEVFSRQIQAHGCPGDIAIAISTSGKSTNVLRGISAARARKMKVIGLTGATGMAAQLDWEIVIPSFETARVQELHITAIHLICETTESSMAIDFKASFNSAARKIVDWNHLLDLREGWRREKKIVVWTNGYFNILHASHLRAMEAAKSYGDILVVGVNSHDAICQPKGSPGPNVTLRDRLELLAGLECIDVVTPLESATPECAIASLNADIHCIGSEEVPLHGSPSPTADVQAILACGGGVKFIELAPGISTTEILNRLRLWTGE